MSDDEGLPTANDGRALDRDRWRAIAAFRAELESPDFSAGQWRGGERDGDTIQMPWFEPSARAAAFIAALAAVMIPNFDWMTWGQTPEGQRFESDVHAIDTGTELQLRRLATALVRVERFSDGAQAASFESGRMLAIARRAEELSQG